MPVTWLNGSSPVFKVLELTSQLKNPEMPTHVVLPLLKGLPKQSMVLAEQVTTIDKAQLRNYVGRVEDDSLLNSINCALTSQLALPETDMSHPEPTTPE